MTTLDVRADALGDDTYPAVLARDHEPPKVLYSVGDLAALDRPRVAIVGARRCTHYGRDVAREFGQALAEHGVCVVSGLALGIDGAAHEGVLRAPREERWAPPVAVVGSGLDVIYPARHRALWHAVASTGAVLSESPLGQRPSRYSFPARNRIIAALADVLVVVEAHIASGSRHTVEAALTRGVPVLAVPGPIHSAASSGTNRLLREGCAPACEVDDVLVALDLERTGSAAPSPDHRPPPVGREAMVLSAVDWTPTALESVALRTGLAPIAIATALAHLEIDGWVQQHHGWWSRRAAS